MNTKVGVKIQLIEHIEISVILWWSLVSFQFDSDQSLKNLKSQYLNIWYLDELHIGIGSNFRSTRTMCSQFTCISVPHRNVARNHWDFLAFWFVSLFDSLLEAKRIYAMVISCVYVCDTCKHCNLKRYWWINFILGRGSI